MSHKLLKYCLLVSKSVKRLIVPFSVRRLLFAQLCSGCRSPQVLHSCLLRHSGRPGQPRPSLNAKQICCATGVLYDEADGAVAGAGAGFEGAGMGGLFTVICQKAVLMLLHCADSGVRVRNITSYSLQPDAHCPIWWACPIFKA